MCGLCLEDNRPYLVRCKETITKRFLAMWSKILLAPIA